MIQWGKLMYISYFCWFKIPKNTDIQHKVNMYILKYVKPINKSLKSVVLLL